MTDNEVLEGLKKILLNIRPNADLTNLSMQTRLVEDLAIDSLMMFLFGLAIEKEFSVSITPEVQLKTVADVCKFVCEAKSL